MSSSASNTSSPQKVAQGRRATGRRIAGKRVPGRKMATSAQPYRYSALPTNDSIRLVELLPSLDGEVRCHLKTVRLDKRPTFDALSYSWANPITIRESRIPPGDQGQKIVEQLTSPSTLPLMPVANGSKQRHVDAETSLFLGAHESLPYMDEEHGRERDHAIYCDKRKIPVTKTLHYALTLLCERLMRKHDAEERGMVYVENLSPPRSQDMWIDAICIDQENIAERNAQVPMMNRIFSSAQYVFAWIGEYDSLARAGFDAILAINRDLGHDRTSEQKQTLRRLAVKQTNLYALTCLFSRLWFRRAWVVQEAVFARRLYLWCGEFFIDWWLLLPVVKLIEDEHLVEKMVNLTYSLLRREPMAGLGKRFARIGARSSLHKVAVTDEEIRGNVNCALTFINGTVATKKALGLPTYTLPTSKNNIALVSLAWDSKNAGEGINETNLYAGMEGEHQVSSEQAGQSGVGDSTQGCAGSEAQVNVHTVPPIGAASEQQLGPYFGEPSILLQEISRRLVLRPEQNDTGARVNLNCIGHKFKLEKPSPPVPVSLYSVVTRFRDVGASDPRDKAFAFLHLATEEPELKANYNATVQHVFTKTAQMIFQGRDIVADGDLSLLSHVQDPSATKVTNLPSWVPDFSVPLGSTPFVVDRANCSYSAFGKSASQLMFYLTVLDNNDQPYEILHLAGYYLDSVKNVAEEHGCYLTRVGKLALQTPKLYAKPMRMLYSLKSGMVARMAPEGAEALTQQPNTMPRVEAMWRTMIADYCSNTYPAPPSAGFGFSDWFAAHFHDSLHISSLLDTHFASVGQDAAHPEMKALEKAQKRKKDTLVELYRDEMGHFICFDCAMELFDERCRDLEISKAIKKLGYVPQPHVARYLPDIKRVASKHDVFTNFHLTKDPVTDCLNLTRTQRERKRAFETRMREVKRGRKMFSTKEKLLGMGPKSVQQGDEIWFFPGAKVPFLLRPVDGGKPPRRYTLVGEAFVLGYMDGEIIEEDRQVEVIGIV